MVTADEAMRAVMHGISKLDRFEIDAAFLEKLDGDASVGGAEMDHLEEEVERITVPVISSFLEFIRQHGVCLFVPNGYTLAQALANRHATMSELSMICWDLDGYSRSRSVKGLVDLVRECQERMLDVILCRPPVAYSGAPKNTHARYLTPNQMGTSVPIYLVNSPVEHDWSEIIVDGAEYEQEVGMEVERAAMIMQKVFFAKQDFIAMLQYIAQAESAGSGEPSKAHESDKAAESGESIESTESFESSDDISAGLQGTDLALYETRCREELVYRGYNHNNSQSSSPGIRDEQLIYLNEVALTCAVRSLARCDEMLSDPNATFDFLRAGIEDVVSNCSTLAYRTNEILENRA